MLRNQSLVRVMLASTSGSCCMVNCRTSSLSIRMLNEHFSFRCPVVELFTHVNCSHREWFQETILQCKGNIVSRPKMKAGKKGSSRWLGHQMVENQQIHLQHSLALTSSVSESDQDKKLYSLLPIPGCLMAMCFPLKGQRSCAAFYLF